MKNKTVSLLIDLNPLVNGPKTGVGHFTQRFLEAVAKSDQENLHITGYYFNFLGRKKPQLPNLQNVEYKQIRFFPSKILSILHRIGLQLPIEFFIGFRRYTYMVFPNFVSMPSLRKTPFALAVHDMAFEDHPDYLQAGNRLYLQRFVPRSIKKASIIITISEFTRDRIVHHYGSSLIDRLLILPLPYEPQKSTTNSKPSNLVRSIINKPFVLFVGTLETRKNIDNLILGFSALPDAIRTKYSLVLAGGMGWKTEKIEAALRATKEKAAIIQTGYISDSDRDTLYKNASIVCLVSHYEGFGMPVLEAMHYKKPVVLSDIPVFREIANDYAVFCQKDDPTDIARAINEALKQKPRPAISDSSWKKNAQAFLSKLS